MLKRKLIRRILETMNSHQSQERRGSPSEFIYSRKRPGRSSYTERPPLLSAFGPTNTTPERYGQDTSGPFPNPPIFFTPINWQGTAFWERQDLQRSPSPKNVEDQPTEIKPNARHASPSTYSGCFRSSGINPQSQPQGTPCQSQIQITLWGQPQDNSVLAQLSTTRCHTRPGWLSLSPPNSVPSACSPSIALQARLHNSPGAEAAVARDMGRVLAWVRTVGAAGDDGGGGIRGWQPEE